MYKIIAMDFDDTLLTNDKKVSSVTINAIKKYRSKGYIILGVTARSLLSASEVCDIKMFDYLILNNGVNIYDTKSDKAEYISYLTNDVASNIYSELKDISIEFDFCGLRHYYKTIIRDKVIRDCVIKVDDVNDVTETITRLNLYLKDESKLEETKDYLNNKYPNTNTFIMRDSQVSDIWLVILPKGIDKLSTLRKLCASHNLTTNDVIFFGDGLNDVSIIGNVGLGVAMANALDEVKEAADDVTLSNEEDGIVHYLDNILKI